MNSAEYYRCVSFGSVGALPTTNVCGRLLIFDLHFIFGAYPHFLLASCANSIDSVENSWPTLFHFAMKSNILVSFINIYMVQRGGGRGHFHSGVRVLSSFFFFCVVCVARTVLSSLLLVATSSPSSSPPSLRILKLMLALRIAFSDMCGFSFYALAVIYFHSFRIRTAVAGESSVASQTSHYTFLSLPNGIEFLQMLEYSTQMPVPDNQICSKCSVLKYNGFFTITL